MKQPKTIAELMSRGLNLPQRIRELQRENELDLLRHLRARIKEGNPVTHTALFSTAWHHALTRLMDARKVVYVRKGRNPLTVGYYKPVRYARPVTYAK